MRSQGGINHPKAPHKGALEDRGERLYELR
jgi:hypothetical protein